MDNDRKDYLLNALAASKDYDEMKAVAEELRGMCGGYAKGDDWDTYNDLVAALEPYLGPQLNGGGELDRMKMDARIQNMINSGAADIAMNAADNEKPLNAARARTYDREQ